MKRKFNRREEEVIQLWLDWAMIGVIEITYDGDTSWGPKCTYQHRTIHEDISEEFEYRQTEVWSELWAEVHKRYNKIPLIKALA